MAIGFPVKDNYVTGDVLTAANMNDLSGTLNTIQSVEYAAGKNKIINGALDVWQRGVTFNSAADGAYTADRFQFFKDGTATCNVTQTTFTPGAAPVAGYESQFYLRLTPASYTSGNIGIRQNIEDVRTFAGQTVTISFYAKASTSTSNTILWLQNFGSGGSAAVNAAAGTVTIGTGWTRHTVSVAIPSVSGKTIGTSSFLQIQLLRYASNATVDIWGIQVEASSTASDFQTATGTIQGELAACQRYYYRPAISTALYSFYGFGMAYSTTAANLASNLPVSMRVVPTVLDSSNLALVLPGVGPTALTSLTIDTSASTNNLVALTANVASGLTANRTYFIGNNGVATGFLGFGAEL